MLGDVKMATSLKLMLQSDRLFATAAAQLPSTIDSVDIEQLVAIAGVSVK